MIQPTIEKVVKETGWNVTGPYSADTLFISALKGDFDVVVTMYHDQGQIALKLVGFQRCITVAGGQPIPSLPAPTALPSTRWARPALPPTPSSGPFGPPLRWLLLSAQRPTADFDLQNKERGIYFGE